MSRPHTDAPSLADLIEQKARTDPGYAVAYGLLKLAAAQNATTAKLDALGFNDKCSVPGVIEFLGIQAERIAEALTALAQKEDR